ncbi:MAG TPA: Rieske 2Fe-2S domain-containing protein [Solirubrobacterales bacterium]|jgi:phenylpropionate dioxygenase-like ring-hydroxylating dioxygenase large terminal subunit|nr:Rieske 2Fe-2S domain-containing protein [Solirubrobacterales bacterium]
MTKRIDLPPYPDSWYRVATSSEVEPGEILSLRYFGEELICWRGEDGLAHVQGAYCAHLGANIGCGGFVKGDSVVCPFHHWRYDGEGRNVEIPYRDKPQRAARLTSYPTFEGNGLIYAWYSAERNEPDWTPPILAEALDPGYLRFDSDPWEIKTHVQEIFENTVDIAHFQFVHGVSGFGAVELVQDGPMFRSIASVTMKTPRGEVNGAVESELWGLGLDYVRQRGLGPGKTIFAATPVEEELVRASYTFFVEKNEETGEPSNYGNGLMREFSRQITQDIPIWEAKIYRDQPRLAMGEGAIVDYRRWVEQFYEPAAVAV